jgi:iron(III) transport system substrate-binding protein
MNLDPEPRCVFCWWLSLTIIVLVSVGCVPRQENAVVLYCATDREFASPILDAFERTQDGTEVVRQFDVEASKTLGLVTRIEEEVARPRCDVFWNNEILHTIRLQQEGLLAPRRWKIPADWPARYRASDGTWVGFAARARVLIVNTELLKDKQNWPTRAADLSDEQWKGKCGLAYPIYGTTATHMSVLASHPGALGAGMKWREWLDEVKSNAVVLAGNKQVALAVSSGELAWGWTDTDDAIIEKESGRSVELVFPDQAEGEFGTLFIPNTMSMVRGSPHPVAGGLLCDALVSEKMESRLTMSSSAHFPVWPSARESSRIDIRGVRWSDADFESAAKTWETTRETLLDVFHR